jgi:uncharacterized caspase-like protein
MVTAAFQRVVRALAVPARGIALALAALLGFASIVSAQEDRRVALVIGVGAYQNVPALSNPVPDAQAVSALFKSLGYEVIEAYDTDLIAMQRTIKTFRERLDGAKAAVFYYAGHGIAVKDDNYILPVDAKLGKESDVDFNTVPLRFVVNQMEQESKVNIVLLDACRDNPFEEQLKRSLGTRSAMVGRGLAAIDTNATHGLLISFATSPRNVAYDGTSNSNSPFTRALLKHMPEPGVPISVVMDRVREDVFRATNEKQRPWVNTSIIGEFFLNPRPRAPQAMVAANSAVPLPAAAMPAPVAAPAQASAPSGSSAEVAFWDSVQKSDRLDEYKAYLAAYPAGIFAGLARTRIENLEKAGPGRALRPVGDTNVAGTATTENNLKLGADAVRETTDRLRLAGFDPGAAAAKFGPRARAAITAWQKAQKYPDTGFFTEAQRNALLNATDEQYARWKNAQPMTPASAGKAGTNTQAERPAKRSIQEAQRQRRERRAGEDREYDVEPTPIARNRRRAPAEDGGGSGAGSTLGAAILGGVIGGAIGGGFRR